MTKNFAACGFPADGSRIFLIQGSFEETLPGAGNRPIALAHIDCDWCEPVAFCLDHVYPRHLRIDDNNNHFSARVEFDYATGFRVAHLIAEEGGPGRGIATR
jgi:asparagine synthase (glutamine-hydrolysing)